MHVHLAEFDDHPEALELFLKHGGTTVRDAGGRLDTLHAWRDEIRNGLRVGLDIDGCPYGQNIQPRLKSSDLRYMSEFILRDLDRQWPERAP